jgi:hypothetical protein
MNKETIEEAAERLYPDRLTFMEQYRKIEQMSFIAGANYQAERISLMEIELNHTKTLLTSCEKALEDRDKKTERMYSEEDLREAYNVARHIGKNNVAYEFDEWFEKFKKK